jgi:hypothetical protein
MARFHKYDSDGTFTVDCAYGCGCWMGPSRSGGPDGLDPFGECPKAPDLPEGLFVVDPSRVPRGTIPDPADVDGYELWTLEGAMPDDSIVRLTVWASSPRLPIFSDAVKAALRASLIALYPSCPRQRSVT